MILLALTACTQNQEHTTVGTQSEATGKGNGGNNLKLATADIDAIFKTLKPRLQIVFEGVSYLLKVEKISPGSTDLFGHDELISHLQVMFGDDSAALKDLNTNENIHLQDDPCIDFRGVPNAAAAVLGEVGGSICFSERQIKSASIKNMSNAAEIFVLALASHELTHHFIKTGETEKDELAAQEVQNFIEQELVRQVEIQSDELISTDDTAYIQAFHDYAKDLFDSAMPAEAKP